MLRKLGECKDSLGMFKTFGIDVVAQNLFLNKSKLLELEKKAEVLDA